jgi:hypothetical protein
MIWRAADGIVIFLARGLIAAEGGAGVAAGRIGTIAALDMDARGRRVDLQCAEVQER